MNLIRHLEQFKIDKKNYIEFYIENIQVGWINQDNIKNIKKYTNVFNFENNAVSINSDLDTLEKRTAAIDPVMRDLYEKGIVKVWRDELYAVLESFGSKPLMMVERGASLILGVEGYGVFLNGYSYVENELHMWIAKRSVTKKTYPGKYDVLVGGGVSGNMTPHETLLKESNEEAGIKKALVSEAMPVGTISYLRDNGSKCAENAIMFNYDILLPKSFKPTPVDGEVDEFELWNINRVKDEIENKDNFKDNCNLVIIDFLIRHGIIDSDYPEYSKICSTLQK